MDILSKKSIQKALSKNSSFNIILFDELPSTNAFAKNIYRENPQHETVVVADSQTNGRGRLGKTFFSPSGTGIYMSIILDSKSLTLNCDLLTIASGVAVCRVLSRISAVPKIKWVNDIFVNKKKVCGILAESVKSPLNSDRTGVVVGIGLNVSTDESLFPRELRNTAGSVFPENISRNEIIAMIITELKNIYDSSKSNLIEEYKSYSLLLGEQISYEINGESYSGIAEDINESGNLIIRRPDMSMVVLKSGEVSLGSSNFCK